MRPIDLFGRKRVLGLLVGNTRALWPFFIETLEASPDLQRSPDPLDTYVEDAVRSSIKEAGSKCTVHFSHHRGKSLVSMLHLAEASGLAQTGPAHLAAHREYGVWFGLRAVLVFDEEAPLEKAHTPGPCEECLAPCRQPFEDALSQTQPSAIEKTWETWAHVRDACPIGRSYRYGENQLRYHYTKDRRALVSDTPI
jgi:hypothetical protein